MWKPIYNPGPWPQFLKRKDNIGVPLMEVRKKYLQEQLLFENYNSYLLTLNTMAPFAAGGGGSAPLGGSGEYSVKFSGLTANTFPNRQEQFGAEWTSLTYFDVEEMSMPNAFDNPEVGEEDLTFRLSMQYVWDQKYYQAGGTPIPQEGYDFFDSAPFELTVDWGDGVIETFQNLVYTNNESTGWGYESYGGSIYFQFWTPLHTYANAATKENATVIATVKKIPTGLSAPNHSDEILPTITPYFNDRPRNSNFYTGQSVPLYVPRYIDYNPDYLTKLGSLYWVFHTRAAMLGDSSEYLSSNISTLENLDTSNIHDMAAMSNGNPNFLNDGDNISNWDVSKVSSFYFAFASWPRSGTYNDYGETGVNIGPMIKNWDMSNVRTLGYMFAGNGFINEDLGSWNLNNITNASYMFGRSTWGYSGMSKENLEATIVGWANNPNTADNVSAVGIIDKHYDGVTGIGEANSYYTYPLGGPMDLALQALTAKGWTISGITIA